MFSVAKLFSAWHTYESGYPVDGPGQSNWLGLEWGTLILEIKVLFTCLAIWEVKGGHLLGYNIVLLYAGMETEVRRGAPGEKG